MNIAKQALLLSVKDTYRQKDLPEYNGSITVIVDNGTEFPDEMHELTLSLPKVFIISITYFCLYVVQVPPHFSGSYLRLQCTVICECFI